MKCIFCQEERPGSDEHVFPAAIGGTLTTDRVCGPCNSTLGSRVDAALSNNFLILGPRAEMGLAGSGGTPPAIYDMLLGDAELADDPGKRVQVKYNKKTGKLDLKQLYHATDVEMPDGTKALNFVIDATDIDKLPDIIQKQRMRRGLPPLSDERIAEEVRKARANVQTFINPSVLYNKSYSFAFIPHALIKIAYELAFLWLGEAYLDDPLAARIRQALFEDDPASTDGLPAVIEHVSECQVFNSWASIPSHHLAFANASRDALVIAVRIFDVYSGVARVTNNPGRYLAGAPHAKLRFLSIDPATGIRRNVPMIEELTRIATEMVNAGRQTSRHTQR